MNGENHKMMIQTSAIYRISIIQMLIIMALVLGDSACIVNAIHINKVHKDIGNLNEEENLIQLRDQLKLTETDKLKQ